MGKRSGWHENQRLPNPSTNHDYYLKAPPWKLAKFYQVLKKCPEDSTDNIDTFEANLSELINF